MWPISRSNQLDELNEEATPYLLVARKMRQGRYPDAPEARVRSRCEELGFKADKADRVISTLSGGEKARLLLGLAAFDGPHLLILDEPTNHLDIEMREALITALAAYRGAVLIVSHDRYLLDAACDRLWLVADGGVKPFDGDLDDYAALILQQRGGEKRDMARPTPPKPVETRPRQSAQTLRRRVAEIEAQMEKLTALIQRVDEALAKPDTFKANPGRAEQLSRDRAGLAERLAEAEEQWLAAQAEIEAAA